MIVNFVNFILSSITWLLNWLPEPLSSLLVIILIALFIKLIISIFLHPLYSRIAGLVVAIIALIVGLYLRNILLGSDSYEAVGASFPLLIPYTFSYLFARGSEVFDTYWDGTYTLEISDNIIRLRENINGGFFANFFGAACISFFLSILALSSMPFLIWFIPIILALTNITLLVEVIKG